MIKKFIRTNIALFGLFLTSLILIILIKFVFAEIDEFWQYGSKFGEIFYDLSIGYIVSYIFYYFVVFLKEVRGKSNVNNRISYESSLLILNGYDIFRYLLISKKF